MAEFKESKPKRTPQSQTSRKTAKTEPLEAIFVHMDEQAAAGARAEANACGAFRKALMTHGFTKDEAFELTRERFFGYQEED